MLQAYGVAKRKYSSISESIKDASPRTPLLGEEGEETSDSSQSLQGKPECSVDVGCQNAEAVVPETVSGIVSGMEPEPETGVLDMDPMLKHDAPGVLEGGPSTQPLDMWAQVGTDPENGIPYRLFQSCTLSIAA
jgi:hypothetical protein